MKNFCTLSLRHMHFAIVRTASSSVSPSGTHSPNSRSHSLAAADLQADAESQIAVSWTIWQAPQSLAEAGHGPAPSKYGHRLMIGQAERGPAVFHSRRALRN